MCATRLQLAVALPIRVFGPKDRRVSLRRKNKNKKIKRKKLCRVQLAQYLACLANALHLTGLSYEFSSKVPQYKPLAASYSMYSRACAYILSYIAVTGKELWTSQCLYIFWMKWPKKEKNKK